MDELEWLKENSPPAEPSRATTRRHRTQLRSAIATEGADGTRPRRPRRGHRTRHRVLVGTAVAAAICAVGAGAVVIASSDGGDEQGAVSAPAASGPSTTAKPPTCSGTPPKPLAIPDGFGTAVAGPGPDATLAPLSTQQVTHWTSGPTTIEQRWPADESWAAKLGPSAPTDGSISGLSEPASGVDARGVARRTIAFAFGGQAPGCATVQVDVSGTDRGAVDTITEALVARPFVSSEPLVTTTGAAAVAPSVIACEGVARADVSALAIPVVATVGGPVTQANFAEPTAALADFLTTRRALAPSGYQALRLDDSSVTYVKQSPLGVVTAVHVVPGAAGWTVADWQASGC